MGYGIWRMVTASAFSAFLAACALTEPLTPSRRDTGSPQSSTNAIAQFSDIPMPENAIMNLDESLVLGSRDRWLGRLVFRSPMAPGAIFDFFLQEMPNFGWQEITGVRAAVSVLTYDRDDRVATIQIERGTILGSMVRLTVSPRGRTPATPPVSRSPLQ